jgi:hypothetical protein
MDNHIQLFQDLRIKGPSEHRLGLRAALITAATPPWSVDLEESAEAMSRSLTTEDIVLFRREATTDFPAASLMLWETPDGYKVPNVVPRDYGSLTITQYNAVLSDFVARVAAPVVGGFGFTVVTSQAFQKLEDLLSKDAAEKLRRFSGAANKSTGAAHPLDQKRWFDFLVAAHRAGTKLSADTLARWLHEVDGWDEESAHRLAGDFETAIDLLDHYDKY